MTTTTEPAVDTRPANPFATQYAHFLSEVKDHTLTVLQDDGLNRRMHVGTPGTNIWSWSVVTWQGMLATHGDIADGFMFRRLDDMIAFFDRGRNRDGYYSDGSPSIDWRYWAEKLAGGRSMEVREYSSDVFIRLVTDLLEEHDEYGTEAEELHQRTERAAEAVCRRHGVDFELYRTQLRESGGRSPYAGLAIDLDDADEVELFGEPLPEESPAAARARLIAEATFHSETEHDAREWLQAEQDIFGSDTYWESTLTQYKSDFVYCCYALDFTVQLWRQYEKSAEAAAHRATQSEQITISDDSLRLTAQFAERGIRAEAESDSSLLPAYMRADIAARRRSGLAGIQALRDLIAIRSAIATATDEQA